MNAGDRLLQSWRIWKARPFIQPGAVVLDIGCSDDGILFQKLGSSLRHGVGIDPLLKSPVKQERYELVRGKFPDDLPAGVQGFDAIVMLAVFEHIPLEIQGDFVQQCAIRLNPGGVIVITVPSPATDRLLDLLIKLHLLHGMSTEEHYGFDPRCIPQIFAPTGLQLIRQERFQLGFNNLFVFQKAAATA